MEASVQCESGVVLKQTADASVQTDHYDVVNELKEQIQNLTDIVRQLTAVKSINQQQPKTPSSPLFEDGLDTARDVITSFCRDPTPRPPQESAITVLESCPIETQVRSNTVTYLPSSCDSTKIAPCVRGSEHPPVVKSWTHR